MSRYQRAEYANALGWFAHQCNATDWEQAIAFARSLGQISGIAALYRQYKDKQDPTRRERVAKSKATRTGTTDKETPPRSVPPVPDEQVHLAVAAVKDNTVTSLADEGKEAVVASPLDLGKVTGNEPEVGVTAAEVSAAKMASFSVVSTAVALAGYARDNVDNQRITQLLDYLKDVVGICPLVNLGVPGRDQELVVLLQIGDTIFGPVRDKSICTTVVATLVSEHLQQRLPQDGSAATDAGSTNPPGMR
jgi:hypothetical protein